MWQIIERSQSLSKFSNLTTVMFPIRASKRPKMIQNDLKSSVDINLEHFRSLWIILDHCRSFYSDVNDLKSSKMIQSDLK